MLLMIRKSVRLLISNCGFFYFSWKKYQETWRKIEEEAETRLLEREVWVLAKKSNFLVLVVTPAQPGSEQTFLWPIPTWDWVSPNTTSLSLLLAIVWLPRNHTNFKTQVLLPSFLKNHRNTSPFMLLSHFQLFRFILRAGTSDFKRAGGQALWWVGHSYFHRKAH